MASQLMLLLFLLSTIAASLILLATFTGLLKLTTTDRQLRQSMSEYQQLQDEWLPLDERRRKMGGSLQDFQGGNAGGGRTVDSRLGGRWKPDVIVRDVRQRQSVTLNERVKQVEARVRKRETEAVASSIEQI